MSDNQNYIDAREKFIIRPQKAKVGCKYDKWVTKRSPKWQRECFVQLRRYLGMEYPYGMKMDTSDDCWEYTEILSLTDEFYDEKRSEPRQWLIGAVAFENEPSSALLEFCWIHPFWRNKKILKNNWHLLQERFGSFLILGPCSKGMEGFLKSVGHINSNNNG